MVRFKNRYLLLEMLWRDERVDESLREAHLLHAIRDSVLLNFGDVGLGAILASLQVKYLNVFTNLCIVRCSREDVQEVWASISFITTIRRRSLLLQLLHMGGTLRTCQRAAIKYSQAILAKLQTQSWGALSDTQLDSAERRIQDISDLEG